MKPHPTPAYPAHTEAQPPVFSAGAAYVRGQYLPIAQAAIPITDWGFLRSDATYDVVTVWDGSFFRLDVHLARFRASCAAFRLDPGLSDEAITDILSQCVRLSGLQRSYVEMICTRGQPPWGSRDPRLAVNQFYAFAVPFVWIANEEQRARGLRLVVSEIQRIPPSSVDPRAKNYHWNDLTMGLLQALDQGAETVLLSDGQGHAVEGPGFNVFCVDSEGVLRTPRTGVLEGVTRRTVLELARHMGQAVQEGALSVHTLRTAAEVFLSSSGGGVLPVSEVDGQPIGDGQPGPLTKRLTEAYWALHGQPGYSLPVQYA